MPNYNLRSGAAAQNPPQNQDDIIQDSDENSGHDLNETMLDPSKTMPPSAENDQLSAIMAALNDLTRAVAESRRDVDFLRGEVQQQQQELRLRSPLPQQPSQFPLGSPILPYQQQLVGGQTQQQPLVQNVQNMRNLQLPSGTEGQSCQILQQPFRNETQCGQNVPQQQPFRNDTQPGQNMPQHQPFRTESQSGQNMPQHQPFRTESQSGQNGNYPDVFPSYNHCKLYDLPSFSGKPEEWPLFYANFKDSTDAFGYSHRQNLMRLQKCLMGEAKEAVASMLIYPNNVPQIIEELEFRFGRPDLLVSSQLQMIKQFPPITAKRMDQIVTFSTKVRNVVAFLNSANCSHHLLNCTLLEELVSKLPMDKQFEWAKASISIKPYATITDFSKWLGDLAKVISVMPINIPHVSQARPVMMIDEQKEKQAAKCCICHGQHSISKCKTFTEELPVNLRWKKVKELKLCFCCLKKGHGSANCRSKKSCGINSCKRPHHRTLHEANLAVSSSLETPQPLLTCRGHHDEASKLFKILPLKILGPAGYLKVYAMFDEGSSISMLDENIAKDLGLKGPQSTLTLQWYGDKVVSETCSRINCEIEGVGQPNNRFPLKNLYTVKKMKLPTQSFRKSDYPYLSELPIEDYDNAGPLLLLGLDNAHLAIPSTVIEADVSSPIAVQTKLGWVAYGPASTSSSSHPTVLHLKEKQTMQEINEMVSEFFATENFGVNNQTELLLSDEDQIGRDIMEQTLKRTGDRFEIGLLWKKYPPQLPSSYAMAEKRLFSIERKMQQDTKFAERYNLEIQKYLQKGYARKLSPEEVSCTKFPIWYLPHFGVINPHKPEKLRVVFDAAAKTSDTSLNTSLVKGPEQAKPLLNILLKFREGIVAVAADIGEMFSQVKIRKEDQQAQRFLWREGDVNNPIQQYAMVSMTFGAICSPCCAEYVKNQNAKEFAHIYPEAADAIINKHYVDDFVCSFNNQEEALRICQEVVSIHSKAGFELRGFVSNSHKLEAAMNPTTALMVSNPVNMEIQATSDKILGMFWNKGDDTFEFKTKFLSINAEILNGVRVPTKRELLKIAMAVFDPFGLIADFLLYSKILVQNCWKENIAWDDPIPESLHKQFKAWWEEFKKVKYFKIPRCLSPNLFKALNTQLHVFVDASQDAFAAVCYLRVAYDTGIDVSFVIGKVRCAPKKLMSVPRLELQAAVLGIRLSKAVVKTQEFHISSVHYWSDSQTVIRWVNSRERRFKAFVSHRVAEILENSKPDQWNWVPTNLNSADAGTRPTYPPKFTQNGVWITGPEFLKEEESCWPHVEIISSDILQDELKPCLTVKSFPDKVIQFTRFSCYIKLKRTIAWIIRFLKRSRNHDDLNVTELKSAEVLICRLIQEECFPTEVNCLKNSQTVSKSSSIYSLVPYLDKDGLLRVNGRIDEALYLPIDARRPVILPQNHHVSKLIMKYYHDKNYHQNMSVTINEMRQKFWIPHAKSVYKAIVRNCLVCKYDSAKPKQPLMGQLPSDRVTPFVRPFTYTGVDLFGPFNVAIGRRREKRWAVIFTCLTIRAAHIEIADDLSADAFILCFRNFINRRGTPIKIRSDNGTNFIAAQKLLKKEDRLLNIDEISHEATKHNIEWIFNCPSNPSSGGCWERLIRIVKRLLLKTLKETTPRLETLRSVLIEAENIINCRPLTEISITSEDEEPITPNHFLMGCLNSTQTPATDEENICLRKQWKLAQNLKDRLWKRWVIEFLPQLMQRPKWREEIAPIKIDDIVIVLDSSLPRNQWLKGRVIKTYPSKDGQVRFADVKTKNGITRRPSSKLAVLNLASGEPLSGSRRGEC